MLITLIYGSTAVRGLTDQDLVEIMNKSESNNADLDVTGILLYKNGNFLQVLEGEEDSVEDLYATIKADPRHMSVQLILKRPLKKREFAHWSMGFVNMDAPPPIDKPGFNDFLQQPIDAETLMENPSHSYVFLKNFKEMMR